MNRVAVLGKEPDLREGAKGRGGEGKRERKQKVQGGNAGKKCQRGAKGQRVEELNAAHARMVGISMSELCTRTHSLVIEIKARCNCGQGLCS